MNSVLEFSGLHCCLFVKVQARQVFVQSFLKACFHKMFCAKDCCATALSEQCFSASCPCFCVASFCVSCLTQLWYNIMHVLHCQHFFKTIFNFFLHVDHPCPVDFHNSISLSSLSITKIRFFYFIFTILLRLQDIAFCVYILCFYNALKIIFIIYTFQKIYLSTSNKI